MLVFSRIAAPALLSALLAAPAIAQDAPPDGERLFRTRCASCHSLEPGQNRIGPSLANVFGRAAGTVEGARYSPALSGSDMVWSAEALDAYLANPRQAVPGTTMTFALRDAAQRAAILEFLRERAAAGPS